MSLVFIVWLVTTLIPSVVFVTGLTVIVGAFVFAFLAAYALIEEQHAPIKVFLSYKKTIIAVVLIACVIPSKEATWYMVGAYGTQKLIENPEAQALASDGVDVLKQLMAKVKKELADDTAKK